MLGLPTFGIAFAVVAAARGPQDTIQRNCSDPAVNAVDATANLQVRTSVCGIVRARTLDLTRPDRL